MSHHLRTELNPSTIVQTPQAGGQSLTDWVEAHEDAIGNEDTSGPNPPTGNVICTSWESGGVTFKVTTPSEQGVAAHREAVDAAMMVFPADS